MKNIIRSLLIIISVSAIATSATYAVWTAQTNVENNTFSSGNASLQVTQRGEPWSSNINSGLTFSNIYPGWSQDYSVFAKNNGSTNLNINLSGGLHSGWNDNANLRSVIKVHVWEFNDANSNWLWNPDETLQDFGEKTLETMRNDVGSGFTLNQINASESRGFLLRFSAPPELADSYQNQNLSGYDFVFNGTTEGAIQPTTAPLP